MSKEPGLLFVTERDAVDEKGAEYIHLECRFDNGEKYAAVIIDGACPRLARRISNFLNAEVGRFDLVHSLED